MRQTIILSLALLMGQLLFWPGAAVPKKIQNAAETYVYVCTGGSSKRYHKSERCKGLDNCKATIKKVTLSYAEDTMKRTPCKICYK